jgi:hypothetical protein
MTKKVDEEAIRKAWFEEILITNQNPPTSKYSSPPSKFEEQLGEWTWIGHEDKEFFETDEDVHGPSVYEPLSAF